MRLSACARVHYILFFCVLQNPQTFLFFGCFFSLRCINTGFLQARFEHVKGNHFQIPPILIDVLDLYFLEILARARALTTRLLDLQCFITSVERHRKDKKSWQQ